MYLSLLLGFFLFPKFLKYWKLTHIKNFIFNTTAKFKCFLKLWYFGQTAKLKCHEIPKLFKINEIKVPRKFLASK